MNKSLLTNLIAALVLLAGFMLNNTLLIWIGLFALSGALTNALAIHMLFEKVPGLVGSGVIPERFEAFKAAIKHLMMTQFFNSENMDRFLDTSQDALPNLQLAPVIEKVNLEPAFDQLVKVIMQSSFGSMLSMFGGASALTPLKEPFMSHLKVSLIEMTQQDSFHELLRQELKQEMDQPEVMSGIQTKIASIIDARLAELTPKMVKEMVEQMIHEHLGWLVVWGGVFGGLIGALSVFISSLLN